MRRDWQWLNTPALLLGGAFALTHVFAGLFIYSVTFTHPVPALAVFAAVVPPYTGILFVVLIVPYLLFKLYQYLGRTRPRLRPFVLLLGFSILAALFFLEELMRTNMLDERDYTLVFFAAFLTLYSLALWAILSVPYVLILILQRFLKRR